MRLVQVGLGRWGRDWATNVVPALRGEVEPVGYVDLDPTALEELTGSDPAVQQKCFPSLEQAISATDPDAVLVTANLPGHVPAVREALQAGRHVLVEKPFAPSIAEGQEVTELARDRGLALMVSQNYRFFPAVREVQRIVAAGELGALLTINIDFRRNARKRRRPPRPGGRPPLAEPLLGDMAIHHFDLIRAVTGVDAAEVECRSWLPEGYGFAGPPSAAALLTLQDGLVVSYRGSWISAGLQTHWAGEWTMEFEQGQVWWTSRGDGSDAASDAVCVRDLEGAVREVDLPTVRHADRVGSLHEFLTAIGEERPPETAAEDNLHSLAITYAAIESAHSHTPVRLT